jgi:hypothetical protein
MADSTRKHVVFEALLDAIHLAVTKPISESDYYAIVKCIRAVKTSRSLNIDELSEEENAMVKARGWNPLYTPFHEPVENIRFGMVFTSDSNEELHAIIQRIEIQ